MNYAQDKKLHATVKYAEDCAAEALRVAKAYADEHGGGGAPSDYETVKSNAATGATHAASTGNPHGTTAEDVGALPTTGGTIFNGDGSTELYVGGTVVRRPIGGGTNVGSTTTSSDGKVVVNGGGCTTEVYGGYIKMTSPEGDDPSDIEIDGESLIEKVNGKANSDIAADAYDETETYAVGDYVTYNGYMYRCNTAIETAEAWNAEHWDKKRFADPDYQFGLDDDTRALSVLKKDEDGEWQTHWSELDLARYELKTVASGGTISDRAVSSITASAAVSFKLPGAASRQDKDGNVVRMCRDFALAVTNTASDGIAVNFTNTTLPTFKSDFSGTASELFTADGEATTVFYFAEIAADVFMVAKKVVA